MEVQVAYRLFRSWTTRVENVHPSRLQTDAHGSRQTLDQIDRLGQYLGGRVEDVSVMSRRHHQGVPWSERVERGERAGGRFTGHPLRTVFADEPAEGARHTGDPATSRRLEKEGRPWRAASQHVSRVILRLGPGRGSAVVRAGSPCHASNGKRAPGETKTDTGVRTVVLPVFLHKDLRRHLGWYAEKGPLVCSSSAKGSRLPSHLLPTTFVTPATPSRPDRTSPSRTG